MNNYLSNVRSVSNHLIHIAIFQELESKLVAVTSDNATSGEKVSALQTEIESMMADLVVGREKKAEVEAKMEKLEAVRRVLFGLSSG